MQTASSYVAAAEEMVTDNMACRIRSNQPALAQPQVGVAGKDAMLAMTACLPKSRSSVALWGTISGVFGNAGQPLSQVTHLTFCPELHLQPGCLHHPLALLHVSRRVLSSPHALCLVQYLGGISLLMISTFDA